jgi:APA family basic amino acid/polyamine antiporter
MPAHEQRRTLGTTDLALIVMGTVVGSGIFLVPGAVMRMAGGWVGPSLLVWVLGGALSLLGALTYAELGSLKTNTGGLYVFIRDAFGPLPAFLYGWTSFLVISTGGMATLAVAFADYVDQVIPVGVMGSRVVAVLMIAVLVIVNVRGARSGATVQNWTSTFKVLALVALALALIAFGVSGSPSVRLWPDEFTPTLASGIGTAMIGVLWSYEGWQYVTFSSGEAKEPQRTVPRAIVTATAVIVLLYVLANIAYIVALGPEAASRTDHAAADAVTRTFGPMAGRVVAAIILVSIFSAANSLLLTTPRMYFAMARDGVFFRRLAVVHPRYRTPSFAICAMGAWSAILAISGTFEQLLTYVVFAGWIFYGLGAASVFVFRRRLPDAHRPFRVPGYPATPLLFITSATVLVLNTIVSQPRRAAGGIIVVLFGIPAFLAWRRRAAAMPRISQTTDQ